MLRPLRALFLLIVLAFGKAGAAVATCAAPDHVTTAASPSSGEYEGCPRMPGDTNHQRADCAAMLSCQASPSLPAAPVIALRAAIVSDQTGVRVIQAASRTYPPTSPPPRA